MISSANLISLKLPMDSRGSLSDLISLKQPIDGGISLLDMRSLKQSIISYRGGIPSKFDCSKAIHR